MSIIARALGETPAPAPKRRRLTPLVQSAVAADPPIAIADVPALIAERTAAYLAEPAPGRALLLALPAGSGKTTAMADLAQRVALAGQRVIYAGPRHDFYTDILSVAGVRPSLWYEWQPRKAATDTDEGTCRYAAQMSLWLQRGYEAMTFCANGRICGYDYIRQHCPYHAQRRVTQPIIFAQHQHVAITHPLMEQCSLLIGDESPLSAFLEPWTIPQGCIVTRNATGDLEQLLYMLQIMCNTPHERDAADAIIPWSGPQLLAWLGGAQHVADVCAAYQLTDADIPSLDSPEAAEAADYLYVPTLLKLLEQESAVALSGATDWVRRVRCEPGHLVLLRRRRPGPLPQHIIWCDATGDPAIYEALLGMPVEVVRPHVKLAGTIYQVPAALNNMASVAGEQNAEKRGKLRRQVERIIAANGYQHPALISYKRIVKELADLPLESVGHFGGERGTNRLEACDALIVVGAPQPQASALVDMAAMLHDTQTRPFRAVWSDREIVAFDGTPYGYPIGGYWDEPTLHALVQQVREAELVQAINRARPLRRAVDVWLLTNVPLAGVLVTLRSLAQIFGAPEGVDPYGWPAFVAWVAEELQRRPSLSSAEAADHLGVQQAAARRYLLHLVTSGGYYRTRPLTTGRGRPALAITRHRELAIADKAGKQEGNEHATERLPAGRD